MKEGRQVGGELGVREGGGVLEGGNLGRGNEVGR